MGTFLSIDLFCIHGICVSVHFVCTSHDSRFFLANKQKNIHHKRMLSIRSNCEKWDQIDSDPV